MKDKLQPRFSQFIDKNRIIKDHQQIKPGDYILSLSNRKI
jgi:hypothetical protein